MKKIISLLMVVAMLFSFAGCGGKKDDKKTDKDAAKKSSYDESIVISVPEVAEDAEVIVVGYTIYEPMNFFDSSNELIGFDTELAKVVFANLGYKVLFQKIEWSNKYTDLSAGTIDCIWNGFTANAADDDGVMRAEKVDFSYNYMENQQAIVVNKNSGIKDKEDLKGKFGCAESGSAGETYGKSFSNVTIKGFIKQTDCLLEVVGKTADFAVVDSQLARSYVGNGDYKDLEIVENLLSDIEFYAIGFSKGSELTAKVNEQLEKLAADGTITKLAKKYGVENTAIIDFSNQK